MIDTNKFIVEDWKKWFIFRVLEKTDITDAELAESLGDDRIAKIQKLQLNKKKEQYEQLKPVGFEHASKKAKKYRQELEDADDVKQMKHLSTILVYNQDNTVGLPTIKETFCADLAWWRSMNQKDSMELANSKWYHLLSDWNDYDSGVIKQSTDWYKLENLFWEYADKWALFCMLGFDNDRYWTSTTYENKEGVARDRGLNESYRYRSCSDTNNDHRVCGFKDSM